MNGHEFWPLLEVVSSNEDHKCTDSHSLTVIFGVPSLPVLGNDLQ